jgi:hypothetical protein
VKLKACLTNIRKQSRTYQSDFVKVVETLVNVAQSQRTWVSDVWIDTEAGKGKELKMLEYACGPGHISLVSGYTL